MFLCVLSSLFVISLLHLPIFSLSFSPTFLSHSPSPFFFHPCPYIHSFLLSFRSFPSSSPLSLSLSLFISLVPSHAISSSVFIYTKYIFYSQTVCYYSLTHSLSIPFTSFLLFLSLFPFLLHIFTYSTVYFPRSHSFSLLCSLLLFLSADRSPSKFFFCLR